MTLLNIFFPHKVHAVESINNPALGPGLQGITGVEFFQGFLPALVSLLFIIGVTVFLIMLILGAIQWITSSGDKGQVENARNRVTNALVGLFILLSIFAIVNLIELFFGTDILRFDIGKLQIGGDNGGGNGGCFVAGTRVKMADGSYKEIQKLKEGEIIYSYNLESEALVEDKVAKVIIHYNYPGGYLLINDTLKVTGNHNVWVVNKESWEKADTLTVGDTLLSPEGEKTTIMSIDKAMGSNTVYNLHLNGESHNYFAEDLLVHNLKDP